MEKENCAVMWSRAFTEEWPNRGPQIIDVQPCIIGKATNAKFQRQKELLEQKQRQKRLQSATLIQPTDNGKRRPFSGFVPKVDLVEDFQDTEAVRVYGQFGSVDDLDVERSPSPEQSPSADERPKKEREKSSNLSKQFRKLSVDRGLDKSPSDDFPISPARRVSADSLEAHPDNRTAQVADIRSSGAVTSTPDRQGFDSDDLGTLEKLVDGDIFDFISEPCPRNVTVRCRVTRDRKGMDRGLYPTYYLHLDHPGHKRLFLLAGRKRKRSATSNYLISCDPTDLSRNSESFVGKVRSNMLGTVFTAYDGGENPKKNKNFQGFNSRCEVGLIIYETNLFGFKGPRKMCVLVPQLDEEGKRVVNPPPATEEETLYEHFKAGNVEGYTLLKNKNPVWNEETQSFVLNFHGRVNQASVKNFQLIDEVDPEYIVMQFGRVKEDHFSLDYSYPLNAIQAFSITLSSFDSKLACE